MEGPTPPPPVLGSANPALTWSVHLDAPGQWHGQQPVPRTADPGVVKQDKSSRGSVDTPKTPSDPQRVRMSSGERPIGTAKSKQRNTEALCQTPPPLFARANAHVRAMVGVVSATSTLPFKNTPPSQSNAKCCFRQIWDFGVALARGGGVSGCVTSCTWMQQRVQWLRRHGPAQITTDRHNVQLCRHGSLCACWGVFWRNVSMGQLGQACGTGSAHIKAGDHRPPNPCARPSPWREALVEMDSGDFRSCPTLPSCSGSCGSLPPVVRRSLRVRVPHCRLAGWLCVCVGGGGTLRRCTSMDQKHACFRTCISVYWCCYQRGCLGWRKWWSFGR